MELIVNIFGTLRSITGKKTVLVDASPGASVIEVLYEMARLYPALQPLMLDERGDLRQAMPVFVNGRNPRLFPDSINTVLSPDDVLSLFSPVSSGRLNVEVLRGPQSRAWRGEMKVNFYATLRDIAGGKTFDFPVNDGVTARELLHAILERFPAMEKELLDENGHLYGHVHFFINGRDVQFLEENLSTLILPGDVINVFPAVGGG